ncbi:DUF560 domain-containing protein [Glaesserella parasuis]|nr:DUF560 domain-containing protein [Glaesserella parasuis]MCT8787407.1 DUF560 domain-containing protein [Glaesserella parasuis]
MINLDKVRSDKVYSLNLTLWKRNWYWLEVTPRTTIYLS